MGNSPARGGSVEICSSYDENTINRGTFDRPRPLLKFHLIHGDNIQLVKDGRIARRKDSFCKGLAFSNRPISVDEIVCLRLCEVGTNWSGVLRFGVTNVDPASFRDIELPKFVCPDLTSKAGYWAKALAERHSFEKGILHFFINSSGELYYGINGVSKGLFLSGINVSLPLWIVVDIYGNSIGVEFLDSTEMNLRSVSGVQCKRRVNVNNNNSAQTELLSTQKNNNATAPGLTSANNVIHAMTPLSARTLPFSQAPPQLRFHTVKGVNITLEDDDLVATRRHGEYYLGYVFTERPIRVDERFTVVVLQSEDIFSGSLAFGLTSCDPITVPASRLPIDSDELLERPEYWVCIKDVAAQTISGDRLSFLIDNAGQVFFSKNDASLRVIMHVDVSVNLWAFFDLYGTTKKLQIIGSSTPLTTGNNNARVENFRNYRASSEGSGSVHYDAQNVSLRPVSTALNLDQLRVALPPQQQGSVSADDLPSSLISVPTTASNALTNASTPSSAPLGTDSFESARLRTMTSMRLNSALSQLSRHTSNGASSSSPMINSEFDELASRYSSMLSRRRGELNDNSLPRTRDTGILGPLTINRAGAADHHQHYLSSPTFRTTLSEAYECLNNAGSNSTQPPASIVVPLSTPPLLSCFTTTVPGNTTTRLLSSNTTKPAATVSSLSANEGDGGGGTECSICMNNKVNAVIYRCGHMCMCFACAKETHRRSGDCPICRTPIIDVIRCYPS